MSESSDKIRSPLTTAERKQLLALACAADRVAWAQACRPAPPSTPLAAVGNEVMRYIEPFSHLIPGKMGRWVRNLSFFANLGRQFGLFGR